MTREVVPVAYITKWAKTQGISVVHDAEVKTGSVYGDRRHLSGDGFFVEEKHWTTDKAVAEERWRQAVETEAKRLKLAAKKYEALSKGAPVYAKEEG